ncbi:hypothetical protein LCGC14_0955070 [marine sediment metagenome]|uniref:Uncharacterized protein n=1 Tax=marine sediment metagenome TaxID=412755 RepID=A0A0F9QZF0_9ZZZZ
MYQGKTLRKMPPKTRRFAKAINGMEKELRRLKAMVEPMRQMEHDQIALERTMARPNKDEVFPEDVSELMQQQVLATGTQRAPA